MYGRKIGFIQAHAEHKVERQNHHHQQQQQQIKKKKTTNKETISSSYEYPPYEWKKIYCECAKMLRY